MQAPRTEVFRISTAAIQRSPELPFVADSLAISRSSRCWFSFRSNMMSLLEETLPCACFTSSI